MATPLSAQVVRRARALSREPATARPPFPPERCAGRFGVGEIRRVPVVGDAARLDAAPPEDGGPSRARWILSVDPRLPPHTPQWNGAVALTLARTLLPQGVRGPAAAALAEIGAAEILLPMRAFRPAAASTDLTMDGVRELAVRFAAPIRLTVRQWLQTGTWRGYGLLWREEGGTPVLRWRAASASDRFPRTAVLGVPAHALLAPDSRLYATLRTGRPQHGVEEVRTGAGTVWWFTRFGLVRGDAGEPAGSGPSGRAVLGLVILDRGR